MITAPQAWLDMTRRATPRPTSWDEVVGNERAVSVIRESIAAGKKQDRAAPHMLLYGVAGVGKSTMSRLAAAEVGAGFIETTASALESQEDVLRLLWEHHDICQATNVSPVIFIDEIHVLGGSKGGNKKLDIESFFTLLEDFVFYHNMAGKIIPDRNGVPTKVLTSSLPMIPFTCIGATTEPGLLVPPLLRRFLIHVEVVPYSEPEIAKIIEGSARRLGWEIETPAAEALSKISRRTPGVAFQMLTRAHNRAVMGDSAMTEELVNQVIADMQLYPLGLGVNDIRILRLLLDRPKGMGQAELCRSLNIAQSQFSEMLEPYLRVLGFVETSNRRMLTPRGMAYMAMIGEADSASPNVRAAVEKYGSRLQVA